jgi:hypothetical protein
MRTCLRTGIRLSGMLRRAEAWMRCGRLYSSLGHYRISYQANSPETSPGSSAGAFLALFPRFPSACESRRALVSLGLDFEADALALRGYVTLRGSTCLALARWVLCSYAAYRPGSRPSKSPPVPGTRGKRICSHPDRRKVNAEYRSRWMGPMPQGHWCQRCQSGFFTRLSTAMTELREFG